MIFKCPCSFATSSFLPVVSYWDQIIPTGTQLNDAFCKESKQRLVGPSALWVATSVCVCVPFLFINSIEFPMLMSYVDQSGEKKNLTRATGHTNFFILSKAFRISSPGTPRPAVSKFQQNLHRNLFQNQYPSWDFKSIDQTCVFLGQHRWTMVGSRNKRGEAGPPYGLVLPGSFTPNLQLLQISASLTLCHFMSTSNDKFEVTQKWNHVTSTNYSNYRPPQSWAHKFLTHQSQDGNKYVSKGWKFDLFHLNSNDGWAVKAHTAESISHACCKTVIGLPNHPTNNKEWEKKNMTVAQETS